MSVDIDWSLLNTEVSSQLIDTLNSQLSRTALPSYLGPLSVVDFVFGEAPPNVELVDVCSVNPDFYQPEENGTAQDPGRSPAAAAETTSTSETLVEPDGAETASSTSAGPAPDDVQLRLRTQYAGSLRVELKTSLLVNYPSPLFMSLPLRLSLTSLEFAADWIVALQPSIRRMHLSLTTIPPDSVDDQLVPPVSNGSSQSTIPSMPILRNLKCDPSEVGETDKHVLRNVGKVEKFVLELVRGLLENELVWPNFITVDY